MKRLFIAILILMLCYTRHTSWLTICSRFFPSSPKYRLMSTSSFKLPNTGVPVRLVDGLTGDQLLAFPAFKTWINTLQHSLKTQQASSHTFHQDPYKLRDIELQAVDYFGGGRIGFIKLKANVSNDQGEKLPGSVFLRGGSVAMMVAEKLVLQPHDVAENTEVDKMVILTTQPRIPAGSLAFLELPAGMLDDSGTFSGAAAKEIAEETGLEISADELINLTELSLSQHPPDDENIEGLQQGIYPSPGGSDEFMPIFLWQKRVPRSQLKQWNGKLTGLRDHGEKIALRLAPLDEVWKIAGRDVKTLAAYALYQGLRGDKRL